MLVLGLQWTQQITWNVFQISFQPDGHIDNGFLTGQSWYVLKSWYTGGGLEQGFQHCFADGLNHSLQKIDSCSFVCGAGYSCMYTTALWQLCENIILLYAQILFHNFEITMLKNVISYTSEYLLL